MFSATSVDCGAMVLFSPMLAGTEVSDMAGCTVLGTAATLTFESEPTATTIMEVF